MDVSGVFNRIKNTLTNTVSEISAALPGNPLLREYDVGEQTGSAGPGLLWKIYNGTKKSTKVEVAIWVLEKKSMDQYNKADRELVLDVFRRGCMQLTKLRHPLVLTVEHSLEESRESLCFCTEPVFASLANVLGQRLNIATPSKELQSYDLHEVEIKYGLMQLSEALAFLHGSAKIVHGNLCPESLIINKGGSWKIAGFDFCVMNSGTVSEPRYQCKEWDTSLPPVSLPNPNYVAPESILHKSCDTSGDLFSLGLLLYVVYYKGKSMLHNTAQNIYKNTSHNVAKFEHMSSEMLEKIPNDVREHEKMLLNPDPTVRPDAEQMSKLPFFNHVGVMTLQYLDNLLQRDNLQKSQFFKGLPKTIAQLPKRVVMQRVLPCLTSEFSNCDMIPFVLPSIMSIAEDCSKEDFIKFVFPPLIPVFKLQKPVQILLILLQKMDLILSKTPSSMVQNHVLPMISSALTSTSLQIQELCMSIMPHFADHLDLQALKTSVLPKIKQIAVAGDTIAIRIHALVCVGKLVSFFDKWYVQDEVLPFLEKIPSKEPGVLMGILGIYQTVLTSDKLGISKQVMASRSLPFLIPLSIENTLNVKQYTAFLLVIKEMMQRIETEHLSKLEQLGKMQMEEDTCLDFQKSQEATSKSFSSLTTSNVPSSQVDDIFNKPPEDPRPQTVAKQYLSLEEKQRLAKMKEQEYRMKKQGDLKPVNLVRPPQQPAAAANKPKDLTSTLLQSNLNAMSLSTSNNGQTAHNRNLSRPMGYNATSQPTNPYHSARTTTPQWSSMMGSPATAAPGFSNPKPAYVSNPTPGYAGANQSHQKMQNLSSFDNLLSMPSHQKSVSMNQMNAGGMAPTGGSFMTQPRPMVAPNVPMTQFNTSSMAGGNTNSKQLSKDDLLDFLG